MMDANTYYLNQHLDRADKFISWVESNEEELLEAYTDYLNDDWDSIPDNVFEGVLDDDYEDAVNNYLENLAFKDVPDDFINDRYESSLYKEE